MSKEFPRDKYSEAAHILVVDDDDRLRRLLKQYLREQGFIVTVAESAKNAEELCRFFAFDLIILDVMMPEKTGIEWLEGGNVKVPTLMLSALSDAEHRIKGLEVGAEDYVGKPFDPKELVLRINSILRRFESYNQQKKWLKFGDYRFDINSKELKRGDETIILTGSETALLAMLAQNPSQPVSRDKLAGLLPPGSNERSVDVQMSRLRKKLESADGKAAYLQTIRGWGYVLYAD